MAWWYCWRNPSCQCRFPSPSAKWTLPHPQLHWSLILPHLSCIFSALLSLFLSIIYQAHGTHHHQKKNCFLEPSHRRHLSSRDSGRGKNGVQVPIHNWKTKLLGKKMRKKKHQNVRYVGEPTSLETLCRHLVRLSYTNFHSAIPPEDVCPWETCTHCPRHIHENIHSSIFRNQKLETSPMFTKEQMNCTIAIQWNIMEYYAIMKMKKLGPHGININSVKNFKT